MTNKHAYVCDGCEAIYWVNNVSCDCKVPSLMKFTKVTVISGKDNPTSDDALRDEIAIEAMKILLDKNIHVHNNGIMTEHKLASASYALADAMIQARKGNVL